MRSTIVRFSILLTALVGGSSCRNINNPASASERDSFASGSLEAYTHYSDGGNPWSIRPDTLLGDGEGIQSVLIRRYEGIADGWIEVMARDIDDGGLVLRFFDNERYYLLAIRDDGAPPPRDHQNLQIYERNGAGAGGFTSIWVIDIAWPRGIARTVRFAAEGTSLRAYIDGSLLGSVTVSGSSMGTGFGIRHYGAASTWHSRYRRFRWENE